MIKAKKIFLSLFLALCAVCLAFAATACKKDKGGDAENPGDSPDTSETPAEPVYGLGEEDWYYYDAADTYYMRLQSGTYTLYMESVTNSSGTYTFNDAGNRILFTSSDGDDFTATYVDGFLSLDFGTSGWTFHKYVYFDVTYVGLDSEVIATEKILNGQPAARIEAKDESADGFYFVNWYGDVAMTRKYGFDISVTNDTTIYARYILVDENATVFKVTYDYTTREPGETTSGSTVNNVLYNLPEADGLLGWWVSETDKSDELSYRYVEGETKLYADTTLFAVWEGSLGASVTSDGVTWETAVGSETTVSITNEDGETVVSGTALSSAKSFTSSEFAALGTGRYTVTVSSGSGSNAQTETLVYTVGGLARVSHFTVEDHVLVFNSVPNATNYYIYIDCGSADHHHGYVDNGTNLVYDFSDCDMPAEGINFIVYAYADGMYASVSETFNYFLALEDIEVTVSDDTISWGVVKGSDGFDGVKYEVYINGELAATTTDLEYSLAGYDKGTSLNIQVKAVAKGYYSEASELTTYVKLRLATPVITGFDQGSLTWTGVSGATGYRIYISGHDSPYVINGGNVTTFITNEDNFETEDVYTSGQGSYEIYIVAIGETESENSLHSETVTVMENEMGENALTYKDGVVSWNYVLSAEKYYVQVGSGEAIEVESSKNSQAIEFYGTGETTITVYFEKDNEQAAAVLTVTVYSIILNLTGGTSMENNVVYLADGDTIVLPDTTAPAGYDFGGWYTLADTVEKTATSPIYYEGDGYRVVSGTATYVAGGDAITELYAFFAPHGYTVTLQISGNGYLVDENGDIVYAEDGMTYATSYAQTVYYDRKYTLAQAIAVDATEQFYGWFTEPNRVGQDYASSGVWTTAGDTTLISGFVIALSFTLTTYNRETVYAVSGGTNISLVSEITVPAYYNGVKIGLVQSNAFTNCTNLKIINLPDTIMYISTTNNGYASGSGAFAGDSNLTAVNIIPSEGTHERYYYSDDGVLFRKDSDLTMTAALIYYPYGRSESDYVIPEIVYNSEERDASDGGNVYSVTTIATQLFRENKKIITVTVPATVTKVESQVFYGCTNLETVTFEGVAKEGTQAQSLNLGGDIFGNEKGGACTKISSVTIPAYLSEFDYSLFLEMSALENVYVSGSDGNYSSNSSLPGVVFDSTGTKIMYYPIGRSNTSFTVTDTKITKIGANAFRGNTKLTTVTIPAWMTEIGEDAFHGCTGMTTLTFSGDENSVDFTISGSAFYGCTSLTSVMLPANIVNIEAYAFGGCTKLVTVTVTSPRGTNYEENAFFSTSGNCYVKTLNIGAEVGEMDIVSVFGYTITTLNIADGNNNYYKNTDGIIYSGDQTRVLYCPASVSDNITLMEGVQTVSGSVFRGKTIRKLTIPASVTKIDDDAFYQCTALTTLTFSDRDDEDPHTLEIGARAFYGCTALTVINLPANTTTIGASAFYNCRKVTSVEIGAGLENLGDGAFENCVKLASVTIGETSSLIIGAKAFKDCAVLAEISFPDGVKEIGDSAFQNCLLLKEFKVGGNVESIGSYAFSGCTKLSGVIFAEENSTLKAIGDYAFQNCTSLGAIDIPEGVAEIGDYAFQNCSALSKIYIPSTVEAMGPSNGTRNVFSGCSSLSEITISEENQKFAIESGVLYGLSLQDGEYVKTDVYMAFDYYAGDVEIPETVTTIWQSAFSGSEITGVTFEGEYYSDLTLGTGAFSDCTNLTGVVLPAGLTTLENNLFSGCTALTSINIPYTVTSIGKPFTNCSSLTSITFDETPTGVTAVGLTLTADSTSATGSFNGSKVTNFVFPERLVAIPEYLFNNYTTIESVYIPSSVTEIGLRAFYNCTNLVSVTFAENSSLMSISNNAFYKCAFESFNMPDGVTTLGGGGTDSGVFYGNTALKYVHLSATLEEIAASTFYGCTALYSDDRDSTTLAIPDSVTKINSYAFRDCSSLENLTFGDNSQLETILSQAFRGCSSLKSMTFPASLKYLGVDGTKAGTPDCQMFYGCTALESVTFETYTSGTDAGKSGVEVISTGAFANSGLRTFSFPETVNVLGSVAGSGTALGTKLFSGCDSLTTVHISSTISDVMRVFEGCSSITSMTVAEASQNLAVNSNYKILTNKSGNIIHFAYGVSASQVTLNLSGSGVTQIDEYAFYQNSVIQTVTFPSTLTYIGIAAFYGCTALTSVTFESGGSGSLEIASATTSSTGVFSGCTALISLTLPSNLEKIGDFSFYGCSSLATLSIPSASTMGKSAFASCTSLSSVTLPNNLTEIGESAFSGPYKIGTVSNATAITSISIPASVTKIGAAAFKGCTALVTVTMQSTGLVEFVGDSSSGEQFSGCTSLTTIDLSHVANIPYQAFYNCRVLNNINLSSNVTTICAGAFSDCSALSSIVLCDGLTSIEESAFSGCIALTSMNIPYTVTTIGTAAFSGSTAFTTMTFEAVPSGANGDYTLTFADSTSGTGVFYNTALVTFVIPSRMTHISDYLFCNVTALKYVSYEGDGNFTDGAKSGSGYFSLPGGMTVGAGAFYGCTGLTTVDLTNADPETAESAFYGCTGVTSVTFNAETTKIADGMFQGCTGITSMALPEGLVTVGGNAFKGCTGITGEVSLPVSVGEIGAGAFNGMSGMTSINFESLTSDEKMEGKTETELVFADASGSTNGTFYGTGITQITIPARTTKLSDYMFYGVSSLTTVKFEGEIQIDSIPQYAFSHCTSLTGIEIPEGVETIGSNAFACCYSITDIEIPYTVTTIEAAAFYADDADKAGLETVTFSAVPEGKNENNYQLLFVSSNSNSGGAFSQNSKLVNIILPERCVGIGAYMFYKCTSLETINIPSGVDSLGYYLNNSGVIVSTGGSSFSGCTSLKTVDFGANCKVDALYGNAFNGCTSLETINLNETSVVSIANYVFEDCESLATLLLPDTLESLGQREFKGTKIEEITLPAATTSLSFDGASTATFVNATNLKNIFVKDGNSAYMSKNGMLYTTDDAVACCPEGYEATEITLEEGESLGGYAFLNCSKLTSVTLPDSLREIPDYAFSGCTSLTDIVIPDGVMTIASNAYNGCENIETISIGRQVSSVPNGTFSGLNKLKYIYYNAEDASDYVGNGTTKRSTSPFSGSGTTDLEVKIGPDAVRIPAYMFGASSSANACQLVTISYADGCSLRTIGEGAFYYCQKIETLTLPDSLLEIEDKAFYQCAFTNITIPAGVLDIGTSTFEYNTSLTSVTFTEGVTTIGENMFYRCTAITSVTIPGTVEEIGTKAFAYCNKLATVTINEGVKVIGDQAFSYYSGGTSFSSSYLDPIASVTIPGSVEEIGAYAFCGCTSMTTVTLNEGLRVIGEGAFYYAGGSGSSAKLTGDVTIPASCEEIGAKAFYGCSKIGALTLSEGVRTIGESAFFTNQTTASYCTLTTLTIPSTVEEIGTQAFCQQVSLTSLTFTKSQKTATVIGEKAFYRCSALTSVSFPSSIEEIGKQAFGYCSKLANITFDEGLRMIGELAFSYGSSSTSYLVPVTKVSVPASVVEIGPKAFAYCTKIEELTFACGSALETIGDGAFLGCTSLKAVAVPSGMAKIGSEAFSGCTALTTATLGGGLKTIGDAAFKGCANITEMNLPDGLTSMGSQAFYGCTGIESLDFPESLGTIGDAAFQGMTGISSVTIPASVTSLGSNAFNGCTSLTSVTIQCGLVELPSYLFNGCTALVAFSLPQNCEVIGDYAFTGCSSLASLTYSTCIRRIGEYAFQNCTSFAPTTLPDTLLSIGAHAFQNTGINGQITLPDSLEELGEYAFEACMNISGVVFNTRITTISNYLFSGCGFTSFTVPESITAIGDGAFSGCAGLSCFTFNGKVTAIGAYAFQNCTALSYMVVANQITTIGNYAFEGCTSLTGIMMGDRTESVGDYAFSGCTALSSVTLGTATAIIGANAFQNCESLAAFNFGGTVTSIGNYAFSGCKSLATVSGTSGIASYGTYVFQNCPLSNGSVSAVISTVSGITNYMFDGNTAVTSVVLGDNITSVGQYSFQNCTSLKTLTIGENVTTLNTKCFTGCTALETINFNAVLMSAMTNSTMAFGSAGTAAEGLTVNIGANVTTIPNYLFYTVSATASSTSGVTNITNIVFAQGSVCASVGNYSFTQCRELKEVEIPQSVTSIGQYSFATCVSLESVTGCESLNTLSNTYAFAYCSSLTGQSAETIMSNLTAIPGYTFYQCTGIETLIIPDNITTISGANAFAKCTGMKNLTIGKGLFSITASSAFQNCTKLEEIHFNATHMTDVTASYNTFGGSSSVGSGAGAESEKGLVIYIGANVEYVPAYIFQGYNNTSDSNKSYQMYTTSVVFEKNSVCAEIGNYAFRCSYSLESIVLPASLTKIGDYAFDYCTSLTTVYFGGNETSWQAIDMGTSCLPTGGITTYWYADTDPAVLGESGNFWHYSEDTGLPVIWSSEGTSGDFSEDDDN